MHATGPTTGGVLPEETPTLTFDDFWAWVTLHPNCIVRAGTPEAVLYDDDDLHWLLASEESHLLVQLVRGKRLIGELLVDPEQVAYVQGARGDRDGEFLFDLIVETPSERLAAYSFVMAHAYEAEVPSHDRAVH
jgi:hypothetical protein